MMANIQQAFAKSKSERTHERSTKLRNPSPKDKRLISRCTVRERELLTDLELREC